MLAPLLAWASLSMAAEKQGSSTVPFGKGQLRLTTLARNAVRIQYTEGAVVDTLPEWIYVQTAPATGEKAFTVDVNQKKKTVQVKGLDGQTVFMATAHRLSPSTAGGEPTKEARLAWRSADDECLYGLGQFQDGVLNVRGLTRRLTQVNTQIAIPMLISSKGYGVLWNNYGLTDFNPCDRKVALARQAGSSQRETVSVTSTEGGKQEVRENNRFEGMLTIREEGDYALMLDVGQKMARRHHLCIDGETVVDVRNVWLPPTTSTIVHLKKGRHTLTAELTKDDQPEVYYRKVDQQTVFSSPVAQAVDYTVFVGTPDRSSPPTAN